MHLRIAATIFVLTFSPAAGAAEQSIVGVWYEDVTYGGSRVISIWDIKPDGSFTSLFRRCLDQGSADSVSSGSWTYANGRMRTIRVSDASTYIIDEYQTESNDGHVWVYRGAAGDGFQKYGAVRFRDVKVEPDSKLPTCDLSS